MPKAEVPAAHRPLVWRKVNARLGVLGQTKKWLTDLLWGHTKATPSKARHYHAVTLDRWLRTPSKMSAANRRGLERTLKLRDGDLLDHMPLGVALLEIPETFKPVDDIPASPHDEVDKVLLDIGHAVEPMSAAITEAEDTLVGLAVAEGGNKTDIADRLGISPRALGRRLE